MELHRMKKICPILCFFFSKRAKKYAPYFFLGVCHMKFVCYILSNHPLATSKQSLVFRGQHPFGTHSHFPCPSSHAKTGQSTDEAGEC